MSWLGLQAVEEGYSSSHGQGPKAQYDRVVMGVTTSAERVQWAANSDWALVPGVFYRILTFGKQSFLASSLALAIWAWAACAGA